MLEGLHLPKPLIFWCTAIVGNRHSFSTTWQGNESCSRPKMHLNALDTRHWHQVRIKAATPFLPANIVRGPITSLLRHYWEPNSQCWFLNIFCLDKPFLYVFLASTRYRTLAIITRGFYYFSIFSHVGVSLMFGSVTMTLGGYKTRAVIIRARLMMASVR